jgi:hypothetical protein
MEICGKRSHIKLEKKTKYLRKVKLMLVFIILSIISAIIKLLLNKKKSLN